MKMEKLIKNKGMTSHEQNNTRGKETSSSGETSNKKMKHLSWSNHKLMRILGNKSPIQILKEKLAAA